MNTHETLIESSRSSAIVRYCGPKRSEGIDEAHRWPRSMPSFIWERWMRRTTAWRTVDAENHRLADGGYGEPPPGGRWLRRTTASRTVATENHRLADGGYGEPPPGGRWMRNVHGLTASN